MSRAFKSSKTQSSSKAAEAKELHRSLMSSLPPLSAERIARGDTREMIVVGKANGDWKVLFISTDGVTGQSSIVEATKPATKPAEK